jgi:branched-subunit amino acid transport protein
VNTLGLSTEAFWFLVLVLCVLGTYVWRAIGTAIAARIHPDSPWNQWFACVAYGLLAALIARILVMPVGVLEQAPMFDRLLPMAVGFVLFFALGRHLLAGTLGATFSFLAFALARAHGIL